MEQDHIWLTDFGLARRFDDLRMSMTGAMLGTPNYMSPEQAAPSRHPTDHRSDIYSLGAALFELLTGRCVFLADKPHAVLAQVIASEPEPLREVVPNASRDLETILLKCLEKDPAVRYQTADELAEDLEAFSQDRSIKARRPGVVERVTRWKRKNKKLVSTAMVAASAALLLLAVSVAGWMAWKDSVTGTIEIASNEGPIAGRLIDESGNASPTFSIPTEKPLPFSAGQHTLQTWSGGRLGESQRVTVDAGANLTLSTELSQECVFLERTVQGVPRVFPLGDRDDLLFFHEKGITRMDGRTGKELWTADAQTFLKQIKGVEKKTFFYWSMNGAQSVVVEGFPDINADGHQDVLIACRHHASLLAFNGQTGALLWHYDAGGQKSKMLHRPMALGDIDGDQIEDYGTLAFSYNGWALRPPQPDQRSLDVVSGKTGKRISRRLLPAKLFDVPKGMELSSACQAEEDPGFGFGGIMVGLGGSPIANPANGWKYREAADPRVWGELLPWSGIRIPSSNGNPDQLLIACGSKIISCDPATGEPGKFNDGQPFELGFVPALQPQVVPSVDKDQPALGLLLAEIGAVADYKKGTKPITRFSLRSLETGEELWRFDADYQLDWCAGASSFPIVADLNGDAAPEILIGDGTDLENKRPQGLASLQALDAKTGKPLWDKQRRAKIRSLDREIQHALLGPDEDGDGLGDVYVVTPMVKSHSYVFVDILSGVTGERLRTVHSEIPVFQPSNFNAIQKPFFLDVAQQGAGLVLAARDTNDSYQRQRQSTVVMSTATGELLNIGNHLEHPVAADGDGDGFDDLFLLKPQDYSKRFQTNQLVSLRSGTSGIKFVNVGERFAVVPGPTRTPMDDVDGDGVRDLLYAPFGRLLCNSKNATITPPSLGRVELCGVQRRVVSGATGKNLLTWANRQVFPALYSANGDFDGDGVDDFLAVQQTDDFKNMSLVLISGAKGTALWKQSECSNAVANATANASDVDGDGQPELLLFHLFWEDENPASSFRLTCYEGNSGDERWHTDIASADAHLNYDYSTVYGPIILDINDDGLPDILCLGSDDDGLPCSVAINGKTGEQIWKLPTLSKGSEPQCEWHSNVIVSDQDQASVFVSAWEGNEKR